MTDNVFDNSLVAAKAFREGRKVGTTIQDSSYKRGYVAALQDAAKVAKSFGSTVPNLEKSDNPSLAFAMAAVMSETGEQIAINILALGDD